MAAELDNVVGGSRRSWPELAAASFREVVAGGGGDVFGSTRSVAAEEEEEELRWAAIERLPTFERVRKGVMRHVLEDGKVVASEIDFKHLGRQDRKALVDNMLKVVEKDNEKFLRRLRDRIDQ